MKYFEFGQEHPELMVMLRGGGVCYRGALAGEHPQEFSKEVQAAHRQSLQKEKP